VHAPQPAQIVSAPASAAGAPAPLAQPELSAGAVPAEAVAGNWISLLENEAAQMLASEQPEVMDILGRQFEAALIKIALKHTHGRKNDAAVRLGIGRNTITRKIQELGIGGAEDD
jgi:two-component system nitrogen regulation response regulator GlnG